MTLLCLFKQNKHVGLTGPRFSEMMFPGEYPPRGGPYPDHPMDEFREPGFGGYSARPGFLGPDMERRPFQDGMDHRQDGTGDGFGPGDGRNGYGRSGLMEGSPGRHYPDEYQGSQMGGGSLTRPLDKPVDRPGLMGAAPESNNLPNTLLSYLVGVFKYKFITADLNNSNFSNTYFFHICMYSVKNKVFLQCVFRILSG